MKQIFKLRKNTKVNEVQLRKDLEQFVGIGTPINTEDRKLYLLWLEAISFSDDFAKNYSRYVGTLTEDGRVALYKHNNYYYLLVQCGDHGLRKEALSKSGLELDLASAHTYQEMVTSDIALTCLQSIYTRVDMGAAIRMTDTFLFQDVKTIQSLPKHSELVMEYKR